MCNYAVEEDVVEAVLTASRPLMAVAAHPGIPAGEITIGQYRVLVVLASRGPQRMADLATALAVMPSTAGRMCDRLVRKRLISRHRAAADRRAVLVSITADGREVVDRATAHRRLLIAEVLARLSPARQVAVGEALQEFAAAAGEVPVSPWPQEPAPDLKTSQPDAAARAPRGGTEGD
jgi:DNA-binding MarR family transcriptional regulator